MLARVLSASLHGIEAALVHVEVDVASGPPCEAAVVEGVRTLSVRTLRESAAILNGEQTAAPAAPTSAVRPGDRDDVDFSEVRGQAHAKRALEIAAAGSHNVLRFGSVMNR
jgi:predicted ATPase with chaperone activity